ncbi:MAG: hypothetical protein ABMA02_16655 [Saprospiraceae bacterium]
MKSNYTAFKSLLVACLLAGSGTSLSALDYYWVNGSGVWSAFSTHWAKIPNPTLPAHYHANVPTADDDVYFGDTNAGAAYTVNVDAGSTVPKCRNMDWTGVPAGTVWGGGGGRMDIYGSLAMDANMSMTFNNEIHFISNDAAMKQIWSKTVHFSCPVYFEGTGGGWHLLDEFYSSDNVYQTGGLMETLSQKVTVYGFLGNWPMGIGQLHLGSSEFILLAGHGIFNYLPAQFDAGASHIKSYGNGIFVQGLDSGVPLSTFYDVSFFGDSPGFAYGNISGSLVFHQNGILHSTRPIVPELNNVVFLENGLIYNANNYHNLTLTAGKTYTIQDFNSATGTDQTILPGGTLTAMGVGSCAEFITIQSWQYGTSVKFVNNSGTDIMTDCLILQDVHAGGTNTLTVDDGVDLGNNTGWIFVNPNPGIDLYWVGGAGDWNDPCHWTTNPVGVTGDCTCIPTGGTNVFFTANSGFSPGDVVNLDADAYCKNMDWTGVTGEPKLQFNYNVTLHIYGSMTLAPTTAMSIEYDYDTGFRSKIRFRGSGSSHTVTTVGQALDHYTIFEGSGLYKFGDAFNSKGSIIHLNGQLMTMGFPVNIIWWEANYLENGHLPNPNTEAWLGDPIGGTSSTITFSNTAYPDSPVQFNNEYEAGKFHAMNSHLVMQAGPGNRIETKHIVGIHDYWKITMAAGTLVKGNVLDKLTFTSLGNIDSYGDFNEVEFFENGRMRGSHTYNTLTIRGSYFYHILDGGGGNTQTINSGGTLHVLNADCAHLAYLYTDGPTTTAKIAKIGGALNIQHVILDNVLPDLTTGATYSAANSFGIQPQVTADWNMTNPAPRNLFWVGGSGTWHDSNHWSLTSGGAGGECPPTPEDNVRFNAASGLGAGSVVDVTQRWAFCKDMDWTGVTGGAKFYTVDPPFTPNQIAVFGSLTFSSGMELDFAGGFWMRAKGPATITSNGIHFKRDLHFWEPSGDWSLADALWVEGFFNHFFGKFRTNDFPVTIEAWWDARNNPAVGNTAVFLGNSTVTLTGTNNNPWAILTYDPGTFHSGTSTLIFETNISGYYGRLSAGEAEFHNVIFKDFGVLQGSKINNNLIFEAYGYIETGTNNTPIHNVEFHGDAGINDSRSYHSMKFAPGKRYTFTAGTTQTLVPHNGIEGQFIAQGLPGQYIEMKSSDPNTPAIIHKDDYDGTSTCTKYLFLTGMTHTGTEDIYVPTPGGDVFNNTGWLFFPCNPCPATIPVLDVAASITTGCPPGQAKLVLAGLKADEWANWYTDPAATTDLVYSGGTPGPAGNMFMPTISGPVTYYARVYSDGGLCESTVVLSVDITITNPPAAFNMTGGGTVCAGSNGTPVGLDGSVAGVTYQLQLDGSDTGSPLAGTGAALDFGLQTATGTYTVVATTDGTACSAVMTGSAVVMGDPNQAPAVVVSSNAPLCTPADLYLFESGGAAVTWNWTGPGGFVSSDQNPVLANATPANSGTYTVVVSDGLGCTNIGSVGVAVHIPYFPNCPTDTSMCINYGLFDLEGGGWPAGGTFSGPGVSQNQFDPAVAGAGVHVLSYSVNDPNNCPLSCTFNYTVFALPVVDCPNDTVVCLNGAAPFALTGATPAGGTYAGTGVTAGEFDPAAAGIGQHVITYTAYASGCAGTCSYVISVVGDQTPTLTVQPPVATLYVNCDQGPPAPDAAAFDYLGNPLSYSLSEVNSPGGCPQEMVLVRTYSVEDPNASCNNSMQFIQTLYVQDNQAPVLFGLADITVSSAEPLPLPTVSAQDNCDPAPSLSFSDNIVPGACPVSHIIERTWTTTDECGNAFTGLERITVVAQAAISGDLSICAGQSTMLTATGGVSYAWSSGGGNTPSITVSPAGTTTYTVTATDAGGCTATASATVALTAGIAFSVTPTSPSCNGATDGSLAVSGVSGGQSPYQYALNNNPLQNSPLFSGLGVGTYTITVQDANGCTAQQQAALPQGPDQPLAIQCPNGVPALTADARCRATLGDYTALATLSGGCGIPLNPMVQTPAPGTLVNPGTVAITLTVSNTAGQSARCVFNVAISGGCGGN